MFPKQNNFHIHTFLHTYLILLNAIRLPGATPHLKRHIRYQFSSSMIHTTFIKIQTNVNRTPRQIHVTVMLTTHMPRLIILLAFLTDWQTKFWEFHLQRVLKALEVELEYVLIVVAQILMKIVSHSIRSSSSRVVMVERGEESVRIVSHERLWILKIQNSKIIPKLDVGL